MPVVFPTPAGVPVEMMSPGSSVTKLEMNSITRRHRENLLGGGRVLPQLAVEPQLHGQILWVGDRVGRGHTRAARAEAVVPLAVQPVEERSFSRLATLRIGAELAVRDVVDDRVAGDILQRLGLATRPFSGDR